MSLAVCVCVCVAMFRRRNRRSTAMSQQTIKEGQLYKRGKLNTEWRQRLFILNSKQLTYFKGGVSPHAVYLTGCL